VAYAFSTSYKPQVYNMLSQIHSTDSQFIDILFVIAYTHTLYADLA